MAETNKKIVIVVGAGASTDFRLPVGSALKEKIAGMCTLKEGSMFDFALADRTLTIATRNISARNPDTFDLNSFRTAAEAISRGLVLAPSIDNFLDTHKDKPEVIALGKMAIVRAIDQAEISSSLRVDPSNIYNRMDFNRLSNTWLVALCQILLAERNFEQFCEALDLIEFVTFNYDRCIQCFFYHAAQTYFFDRVEAPKVIMEHLHVTHVYGSIGPVATQTKKAPEYAIDLNFDQLIDRRESIRTFTEGVNDDIAERSIKNAFRDSEVLIFLGFGFHSLNIDRLPTRPEHQLDRILLSNRGQSSSDMIILKEQLSQKFQISTDTIMSDAQNAVDIFREYFRYLGRPPKL